MEDSSYKNAPEGPKEDKSEESCDVKIQPIDIVEKMWKCELFRATSQADSTQKVFGGIFL